MNKQNDNQFNHDNCFCNQNFLQQPDLISEWPAEVFGDPEESERCRLTGIRGWLIFYVILSISGGILRLIYLDSSIDSVDFYLSIAVLVTSIAGLVLIFQRKALAIKVCILNEALCIISNLWVIKYMDYFALIMAAEGYKTGNGYEYMLVSKVLLGGIVAFLVLISILWIVYFLKSRRVKYTLVR